MNLWDALSVFRLCVGVEQVVHAHCSNIFWKAFHVNLKYSLNILLANEFIKSDLRNVSWKELNDLEKREV